MSEVFQGFFFAFVLQRKDAPGTRLPMINVTFFIFKVNVQYCAVPFIFITVLQEKSKWGNVVGGWVIIICFKILACLILGPFFELLFTLFLMEFIMSIIKIYIIIITIVMVIFLFLLCFLLFWLLISPSITKRVKCIFLRLSLVGFSYSRFFVFVFLLLFLLSFWFVLPSILFINVCIKVLYPLIFLFIP